MNFGAGTNPIATRPGHHINYDTRYQARRYCIGYRVVINITDGTWSCQCGAGGTGIPKPHWRGQTVEGDE